MNYFAALELLSMGHDPWREQNLGDTPEAILGDRSETPRRLSAATKLSDTSLIGGCD